MLINNASTFFPTPVGDITEIDWDDLLGTNLKAPLFLSQAAAPALHERQGLIINIADIHGMRAAAPLPGVQRRQGGADHAHASPSPASSGPQVRVNAVAPGPVMWPEDGLEPALQEKIIRRTALRRPGRAAGGRPRLPVLRSRRAPTSPARSLAVDGGRSIGW